jgi:hypothetical protein
MSAAIGTRCRAHEGRGDQKFRRREAATAVGKTDGFFFSDRNFQQSPKGQVDQKSLCDRGFSLGVFSFVADFGCLFFFRAWGFP